MARVSEGDLDKMGLLFERYKQVLFGFFYHMNGDAALSEDLVQNVFMRILKYRHAFNGSGEFKVWMFHIARNVNIDHYKKNKLHASEALENWSDRLGDEQHNREEHFTHQEDLQLLRAAMRSLDREKREVLTLSKIKGLKYRQVGELLNCSEGAVKVKVFRALKALRAAYEAIQARV